jgi:hypothetical protein
MPPSERLVASVEAFQSEFAEPTWTKDWDLLWGTILARGQRTVNAFVRSDLRRTFVSDETLERRGGRRFWIRGHYRDPLAFSKDRSVAASGIRWIVLTRIVTPPWSNSPWALPVLSLPGPTPQVSAQLGRRH